MKKLVLAILLSLFVCTAAHADIFGNNPHHNTNLKISATASDAIAFPLDPGTILSDVSQAAQYLGVNEGTAYDFKRKAFVNYAGATIYTYQPYGLSLNFGMLNDDGIGETVDWAAGQFIPVDQVPLLNKIQSLKIGAGVAEDYISKSDSDPSKSWQVGGLVDFIFKTTW